jgi:hypothetical protein
VDKSQSRRESATDGRTLGHSSRRTARDAPGLDREDLARLVARSRAAQGLPPRVTDPTTLARIAALLAAAPSIGESGSARTRPAQRASATQPSRPRSLAASDGIRSETPERADAVGGRRETLEQAPSSSPPRRRRPA